MRARLAASRSATGQAAALEEVPATNDAASAAEPKSSSAAVAMVQEQTAPAAAVAATDANVEMGESRCSPEAGQDEVAPATCSNQDASSDTHGGAIQTQADADVQQTPSALEATQDEAEIKSVANEKAAGKGKRGRSRSRKGPHKAAQGGSASPPHSQTAPAGQARSRSAKVRPGQLARL